MTTNTDTDALTPRELQSLRNLGGDCERAADTIERLTREMDEAVADAARYRWLRQRHKALCRMYTAKELGLDLSAVYVNTPEKLDGVIDAAIRTTKATTTAEAPPNVTAFVLLDHIRNDEELEAYVQAREADAFEQAVARERERCAAIAERVCMTTAAPTGLDIANAIRTTKATT